MNVESIYVSPDEVWYGLDASPDCPDSLSFKVAFLLLVLLDMVSNMFPKSIVSVDVKLVEVKHDVKPDEVNDDVKPGARAVFVEVDIRA